MADNIVLNAGTGGETLATDDDGTAQHQYVKVEFGGDNTQTRVTTTVGLPTDPLDRAARDCGKVDVAALDQYTPEDADSGAGTVNTLPVTLKFSAAGGGTVTGGGGTEATALRVTLASDSTGVLSVDDNAGSLTVDGTVTANAGTGPWPVTDNSGALTIDWAGTAPPIGAGLEATALRVTLATDSTGLVSVDDNAGSLTVDGTFWQATQPVSGTFWQAAQPVTDNGGNLSVDWAGTSPPIGAGVEATALRVTLATDSTGLVSVDDNAGSLTVDNAALSVVGTGVEATALRVTIASDSTGVLSVDDNGGTLTVDGTVTANLAAGTNTNEVVGDVAHDAGVAGNPVLICGVAQNVDDTAPPNRISAESDATRLATDFDGTVFAHPHGPQVWSYHANGSSALTDAAVHAAPGAGLSLYVTDIVCSSGAATAMNIFFEESTTTVLGPYYLEAIAGRGVALHFQTPKKVTANTALTVTTSAAIAHSVDVTGFTAQG